MVLGDCSSIYTRYGVRVLLFCGAGNMCMKKKKRRETSVGGSTFFFYCLDRVRCRCRVTAFLKAKAPTEGWD